MKKQSQDQVAFSLQVKELKQQIVFKQNEIDMKDREVVSAKRESSQLLGEAAKLHERIEQLNNILKNKQNDNINLLRQIEDLKL